MNLPDDKEEVEELDNLDEELTGALNEASTVVEDAPPEKESSLSTVLEILVLGLLLLMAGGGLYFGYTAKMTADSALAKIEKIEKSTEDLYAATLAVQQEVKDIGEKKIRQLSLDIDQASSASRSHYSQLQREMKELKKALKPPPPPRAVKRREPAPPVSTPASSTPKPATISPDDRFYEIQRGDTLGDVAKRYGMSVQRIQQLNPKVDALKLQIGQKIRLR